MISSCNLTKVKVCAPLVAASIILPVEDTITLPLSKLKCSKESLTPPSPATSLNNLDLILQNF